MKDLSGKLEIFIITNGRSTYKYCKRAIDKQIGVKFNTTIIKDKEWLEANKEILKLCKSTYFMRVDDDMILNHRAVHFAWNCVRKQKKNIALRGFRLWEPYSNKVCKGLKVYNHALACKVGYRISKFGKIDKMFTKDAEKMNIKVYYSQDVVAIHSCSTFDEHLKYALMRNEDNNPDFKKEKRWMKDRIQNYNVSMRDQYIMSNRFLERYNLRKKTKFGFFLKDHSD